MTIQIIAERVTTLTDARYFAAMGADWIGFDLRSDSKVGAQEVKTFIEWIEGPRIFIDVSGRHREEAIELVSWIEPNGVLAGLEILANAKSDIFKILEHHNSRTTGLEPDAIILSELLAIDEMESSAQLWCRAHVLPGSASGGIALPHYCTGVVVEGGAEEKTGVKSFEEIDALISQLKT